MDVAILMDVGCTLT